MTANGWLQIGVFALAVLLVTKPLGIYIHRVYDGSLRWLAPVERSIYRVAGVDPRGGAALDPLRGIGARV